MVNTSDGGKASVKKSILAACIERKQSAQVALAVSMC